MGRSGNVYTRWKMRWQGTAEHFQLIAAEVEWRLFILLDEQHPPRNHPVLCLIRDFLVKGRASRYNTLDLVRNRTFTIASDESFPPGLNHPHGRIAS
jgi:hypothetical protein